MLHHMFRICKYCRRHVLVNVLSNLLCIYKIYDNICIRTLERKNIKELFFGIIRAFDGTVLPTHVFHRCVFSYEISDYLNPSILNYKLNIDNSLVWSVFYVQILNEKKKKMCEIKIWIESIEILRTYVCFHGPFCRICAIAFVAFECHVLMYLIVSIEIFLSFKFCWTVGTLNCLWAMCLAMNVKILF